MRAALVVAVWAGLSGSRTAHADEGELYERLYPAIPVGTQLSLSQELLEEVSELGNQLGMHMGVLSQGVIGLEVDARGRRARVRVGGGDERYLHLQITGDMYFADGAAQVVTQIDLGIAGRHIHLELPEVDMVPTEYRGDRGVELRLPLFRRRF